MHLKQKGIHDKLIASCFDEIDENDYLKIIHKVYENYESKLKGLNDYQKKLKTIKYLLSRGFEYDAILQVND